MFPQRGAAHPQAVQLASHRVHASQVGGHRAVELVAKQRPERPTAIRRMRQHRTGIQVAPSGRSR